MDVMNIVYAILVLGVLGALFGLVLAVASKVFEVKKGPREEERPPNRRPLKRSFFSCKKEPKNTPEGLGVPLAAASGAGRGPAAPPPLKRWAKLFTFALNSTNFSFCLLAILFSK